MNNVKRYGKVFIIIIVIMILSLLMEKTIPNNNSRINIAKSEKYYYELYKNNKYIKYKPQDLKKEFSQLSIIYLENNKNYYSEMIEMNIDSRAMNKYMTNKTIKSYVPNSNYSRYWNGNLIFLKPLLSFFTMKTIFIIYTILFIVLFCILIYKLFKQSKLLSIIFTITSIIMNFFLATKFMNIINIFIISMIASIILLNMYEKKNNKNIDILFLIVGMLTSFFSINTCETLTLTLPLFIYIFINYKDKKINNIKEITKYIGLWLFGLFATTIVKWLLLTIHYNGNFINIVFNQNKEINNILLFFNNINIIYLYILLLFINISIIISIILPIIDKNYKYYYISLIIISIIPIIRLFILTDNSIFTKTSLLPLIMLWITFDIKMISIIKNKKVIK